MYDMYRRKSLKTLGNNGSNYLLGRSVASKLRPQQAAKVFWAAAREISEKMIFLLFGPLLGNEERYWDGP